MQPHVRRSPGKMIPFLIFALTAYGLLGDGFKIIFKGGSEESKDEVQLITHQTQHRSIYLLDTFSHSITHLY